MLLALQPKRRERHQVLLQEGRCRRYADPVAFLVVSDRPELRPGARVEWLQPGLQGSLRRQTAAHVHKDARAAFLEDLQQIDVC